MTARVSCVVPGCRCTTGKPYDEWICTKHWKLVPTFRRRRKFKAERAYRRRFGDTPWHTYPAGSPDRLESVKLDRMCRMAWRLCKTAAIERALGI